MARSRRRSRSTFGPPTCSAATWSGPGSWPICSVGAGAQRVGLRTSEAGAENFAISWNALHPGASTRSTPRWPSNVFKTLGFWRRGIAARSRVSSHRAISISSTSRRCCRPASRVMAFDAVPMEATARMAADLLVSRDGRPEHLASAMSPVFAPTDWCVVQTGFVKNAGHARPAIAPKGSTASRAGVVNAR